MKNSLLKIEIGAQFDSWTVIGSPYRRNHSTVALCRCSCGAEKPVILLNVVHGRSPSCGHEGRTNLNIEIGSEFERWTVIGAAYKKGSAVFAPCECRCGTKRPVAVGNLNSGASSSCGCLERELTAQRNFRHGGSVRGNRDRLYKIHAAMIQRCTNKKCRGWKDYGGRGISIYKLWLNYSVFREWAMSHGYKPGLTIERKNVNKNYCPSNCEWIPRQRQNMNRRDTRMYTAFGETKCISDWADDRRCTVGRFTLIGRLVRGWNPEEAIVSPKMNRWSRRKKHLTNT